MLLIFVLELETKKGNDAKQEERKNRFICFFYQKPAFHV